MVNMTNMQSKINKLLSVFTKLITELENAISELNGAIVSNEELIIRKEKENTVFAEKIEEYEHLKQNIENIIK